MKLKKMQIGLNVFFAVLVLLFLLPILLIIIVSLTSDTAIIRYGYSFWPKEFSLEAYNYLWSDRIRIGRAFLLTIAVTAVGTLLSLLLMSLLSYVLSRKEYILKNVLGFYVFFAILFNGGLVPTYMMYTQYFHIKNTYAAYLIPNLLVSGFFVMMMRTYFSSSIPDEIIESARVDGAGEIRIFARIAAPMAKPIFATVGLMQAINYSGDWYNGLQYITNDKLFTLQNLLNRILQNVQALRSETVIGDAMASMPLESARMAMAVIGILPIIVAYPFFQQYFVKGITVGSVKG